MSTDQSAGHVVSVSRQTNAQNVVRAYVETTVSVVVLGPNHAVPVGYPTRPRTVAANLGSGTTRHHVKRV